MTASQVTFIKKLAEYQGRVSESNNLEEIIKVAKKVLSEADKERPANLPIAGIEYPDEKGKALMLEVLKAEITTLENDGFSNLYNAKSKLNMTFGFLMTIFSSGDLSEILASIGK